MTTATLTHHTTNSQSIQLFVNIDAYPDLIVLDFEGSVGLSMLYEFKVNILSKQLIDDDKLLGGTVSLICQMGHLKHSITGILEDWQITDDNIKLDKFFSYSFTLVPLVKKLQQNKRIATYLNKTLPDIINGLLNQQQLNFRLDLQKNYLEKNFVFQYQESDWHFITRWLERLGLFYYFEHTTSETTLVITDSNTTLSKDSALTHLNYQNYSQDPPPPSEARLWQFSLKKKQGPKNLKLVAYDPDKASQQISIDIAVDPNGQGEIEIWQEDLLSPKEIALYAQVLNNIYMWQTQVFAGSAEQRLLPGTFVQIDNTYQAAWNKKNYLVVRCHYSGTQRSAILNSLHNNKEPADDTRIFRCDFEAIPLSQTFCAPCTTKAPVIGGVLPAFIIDSTDSGINIPINNFGCYQVAFSANSDAKTFWLRMCQPYTGDNYGSMAPLHAGTEVMLSFLYGNPDLPIIINAVFNSTHQSTFTQNNSRKSGMISAFNNRIIMNDQDGNNNITLSSPNSNSSITIGANSDMAAPDTTSTSSTSTDTSSSTDTTSSSSSSSSSSANSGIQMYTTGNVTTYTGGYTTTVVSGGKNSIVLGTETRTSLGGYATSTNGVNLSAVLGFDIKLVGALTYTYSKSYSIKQAIAAITTAATAIVHTVSPSVSAMNLEMISLYSPSVEIESLMSVSISCGFSTITITPFGITIDASMSPVSIIGEMGVNIDGGAVGTTITGNVDITGMVTVTGSLDVTGPSSVTGAVTVTGNTTQAGVLTVSGGIVAT